MCCPSRIALIHSSAHIQKCSHIPDLKKMWSLPVAAWCWTKPLLFLEVICWYASLLAYWLVKYTVLIRRSIHFLKNVVSWLLFKVYVEMFSTNAVVITSWTHTDLLFYVILIKLHEIQLKSFWHWLPPSTYTSQKQPAYLFCHFVMQRDKCYYKLALSARELHVKVIMWGRKCENWTEAQRERGRESLREKEREGVWRELGQSGQSQHCSKCKNHGFLWPSEKFLNIVGHKGKAETLSVFYLHLQAAPLFRLSAHLRRDILS